MIDSHGRLMLGAGTVASSTKQLLGSQPPGCDVAVVAILKNICSNSFNIFVLIVLVLFL